MTQHDEDRYRAAMHAVQTGVAAEMTRGSTDTDPKHLRVGINAAMVSDTALVRLLIDRGVITLDEYYAALADEAEAEKARYEQRLRTDLGHDGVHLA
jgi:hypothetical protein